MALNIRQRRAYKNTIDIWTTDTPVGAVTSGKPGDETYTLSRAGVPCHYKYTVNVDQPSAAGSVNEFTLLTTDEIHMEANVAIRDSDITVNVSTFEDGSNQNSYGDCHRVLGASTVHDNAGFRKANKLSVEIMIIEKPPAEIVAYYGLA